MDKSFLPHLNDLSIYQLRMLGRQVGVALPTTLKKQDLIDKIKAIVLGNEMPYVKKTNKGRPAKGVGAVDILKSNDEIENLFGSMESYYNVSQPDIAMFQSIKPQTYKDEEESLEIGYVKLNGEGFGFLLTSPQKSKEPIYIKQTVVVKFKLQNGDKIEAKVIKNTSTKFSSVEDVIRINNILLDGNIISTNFNDLQSLKKTQLIFENHSNSPLEMVENLLSFYCGDRAIYSIEEKKSVPTIMFDLVSKLNNSNSITNIIFAGADINQEFIDAITEFEKVTVIGSSFGDSREYSKIMLEMALANAKRMATIKGNNVAIVVQNLTDLLNLFDGEELQRIKEFCKQYFVSSKQCKESSLTCVYSFVNDVATQNEYETNENLFVKFLPYKYLTKSQIKFNILESFRIQMFNQSNDFLKIQQKIEKFLENGDYLEKHSELELLLSQSENIDEFLKKI